jgi:hypothetical protein
MCSRFVIRARLPSGNDERAQPAETATAAEEELTTALEP